MDQTFQMTAAQSDSRKEGVEGHPARESKLCSKWHARKELIRYGHTFLSHHLRYLVLQVVIYCGVVHFVTSVPVFTHK